MTHAVDPNAARIGRARAIATRDGADLRDLRMVPHARRSPFAPIARRVLLGLVERLQWGTLRVVLPDGSEVHGGTAAAGQRDAVLHIHSERAFHRIARNRAVGFGEAWVAGDIDSPNLPDLLEVLGRNLQLLRDDGILKPVAAIQRRLPVVPRVNSLTRAKKQIGYHYDVGNAFYEHLLDHDTMTYSCAIFEHAEQSLADAQRAKYRALCERMRLEPGQRVLEIGCGWGGFARFAASEYGVHVTGVTLSEEQLREAQARVHEDGLDARVDLQLRDYRTLDGTFDRIVSIEMLEAVGARGYDTFFRQVDQLLAPGGIACVQVIGFQDREYRRQLRAQGWIRRYIFPGGFLPSITALTRSMTRSSRLMVHEVAEIGHHYAPTLAAWQRNIDAAEAELRELGCDDEFLRTWQYYLASCEAGFRSRIIRTMQLTLTRALNDELEPTPAITN